MTSKEFLEKLDRNIKRMEIRRMIETNPAAIKAIDKRIEKRRKFADRFRAAFCNEINYTTLKEDHENDE